MEAKHEFGFIGTGHMGGALLRGIAQTVPADEIILSDGIPSKAQFFADELDCETGTNDDAAQAKYIVLGVKPQMLRDMLKGIYATLSARQDRYVLISMAAGVSMDTIRSMLGLDCPVIRIMPNTAAEVGQAVIMLAHDSRVQTDEAEYVKKVLSRCGMVDEVPEHLIDAGSAVSGCGPAFVYMMIEALSDGAVACGLPRDKAMTYAAQTLKGAAMLYMESGKHPGSLKDDVCSPAGSTIQGVRVLEERGLRGACIDAVIAAYEKTKKLGKG